MIELIQGEGGVVPVDSEFVKEIAHICEEKDLVFVVDEIQTGVSRTGTFFCYEQFGVDVYKRQVYDYTESVPVHIYQEDCRISLDELFH